MNSKIMVKTCVANSLESVIVNSLSGNSNYKYIKKKIWNQITSSCLDSVVSYFILNNEPKNHLQLYEQLEQKNCCQIPAVNLVIWIENLCTLQHKIAAYELSFEAINPVQIKMRKLLQNWWSSSALLVAERNYHTLKIQHYVALQEEQRGGYI